MNKGEHSKKSKLKNKNKTKIKKEHKKNPKLRKIIGRTLLVLLFVILILAGIVIGKIYTIFSETKVDMAQVAISHENSVVKDIDGNIVATLSGDENRESLQLSEMSEYLPKAFVAIEDERFYEHGPIDVKRTMAATVKLALSKIGIGSSSYGGSTITQQMVKNLTKDKERTWERKVREISRAYYIEKELSKDQILELYLNLIFLGDRAYGVEVASNYYFNKSASDLDLAESAFLAGINNTPNSYNPFNNDTEEAQTKKMDLIKRRTKTVLAKMLELNKINQEEYDAAVAEVEEGLKFEKGKIIENVYSYHTDAAVNEVIKELADKNNWTYEYAKLYVTNGGVTIYSTQNTKIQDIMEDEFKQDKYKKTATVKGVTYESQAAMTMIDHKTGYVVATVGGLGEKTTSFGLNRATQSPRQTGSSMKPLAVVAPGIEKGIITAATCFDDVPSYIGNTYVKNSTGYRGLCTTRYAIETSQNVPMAQAILKIGTQASIDFLKTMGITTLDERDNYYGLALGGLTKGITTLEMAGAYACIANDGEYIEPTFFTKVTDKDGNTILETSQETRTVMSKSAAYVVKEILTQPVKSGTATYCAISGMSVAAKTGTTDDNFDRWLCGFTPYYSAATWYGYDYNVEVIWSGTNPAGLLWSRVMKNAHQGLAGKTFASTKPDGVVTATVCKSSGMLATDICKEDPRGDQSYTEYFVKGTVPTEQCTCHVKVDINIQTGLLANEYCPDKETKIFITRPNVDTDTAWQKAKDAQYTLTIKDHCTLHVAPVIKPEEPDKPDTPDKPDNPNENTTGGNTIDGNTTG